MESSVFSEHFPSCFDDGVDIVELVVFVHIDMHMWWHSELSVLAVLVEHDHSGVSDAPS